MCQKLGKRKQKLKAEELHRFQQRVLRVLKGEPLDPMRFRGVVRENYGSMVAAHRNYATIDHSEW